MEQMPKQRLPKDSEENRKKTSKTAIAAAALGALVAAGEPATAWAGADNQPTHEYRMSEAEGLRDSARLLIESANRNLASEMPKLRAQQFVWQMIDMQLGGQNPKAAQELLPAAQAVDSSSPGAKMVIERLQSIAGSFDPHSPQGRDLRNSLNNYVPKNVAPDMRQNSAPQQEAPSGGDTNDPYRHVPKNRAPDLQ